MRYVCAAYPSFVTIGVVLIGSGRQIDHSTTSMPTRRGYNRRYVQTDPHLTVYVGEKTPVKDNFLLQGHIYVTYEAGLNPTRMSKGRNLRYARYGVNPEMFDRQHRLVRTIGI